jgi:hypothetical protein
MIKNIIFFIFLSLISFLLSFHFDNKVILSSKRKLKKRKEFLFSKSCQSADKNCCFVLSFLHLKDKSNDCRDNLMAIFLEKAVISTGFAILVSYF